MTHYEVSAERIRNWDSYLRAALDALFGLVLVTLALFAASHRYGSMNAAAHFSSLLRGGIGWLEKFPIGFKLNERLTASMGRDLLRFLDAFEWMSSRVGAVAMSISALWPTMITTTTTTAGLVIFSLLAGIILGGCGLLALAFDLLRLCTAHIYVLGTCYRLLYTTELYLLGALWRLFRGKKKNILRDRTDTMEYDSTQLLLGTILFTVALFLFTTIFVYHIFFSVAEFCIAISAFPLLALYLIVKRFPYGILLERWRHNSFIDEVYLLEDGYINQQSAEDFLPFDVTYLETRERSYTLICKDAFARPVGELLAWYLATAFGMLFGFKPSKTLVESIHGRPQTTGSRD